MAEAVVDGLEVIGVDEGDADRLAPDRGLSDETRQLGFDVAAVPQPCEAVLIGAAAEQLALLSQGQGLGLELARTATLDLGLSVARRASSWARSRSRWVVSTRARVLASWDCCSRSSS